MGDLQEMAAMDDVGRIKQFWRDQALSHIKPARGGEYPEGMAPLRAIQQMVGARRVLDYGCGYGRLAQFFSADAYVGADICEDAILEARRQRPDHEFVVTDGAVPFCEEVVLLYTVLVHYPDAGVRWLAENISGSSVIIAEIMEPELARPPYTHNRTAEDYERLFGRRITDRRSFAYPAYAHKRTTGQPHALTVIELC